MKSATPKSIFGRSSEGWRWTVTISQSDLASVRPFASVCVPTEPPVSRPAKHTLVMCGEVREGKRNGFPYSGIHAGLPQSTLQANSRSGRNFFAASSSKGLASLESRAITASPVNGVGNPRSDASQTPATGGYVGADNGGCCNLSSPRCFVAGKAGLATTRAAGRAVANNGSAFHFPVAGRRCREADSPYPAGGVNKQVSLSSRVSDGGENSGAVTGHQQVATNRN